MTSAQTAKTSHKGLYETDFIQWVDRAAELLRREDFDELDIQNLIDEVETLGRSEKNSLKSNLRVLLMHLLKWQYQPEKRSSSWRQTILEHRDRLQLSLEDSPSLRNYLLDVLQGRYEKARKFAAVETSLIVDIFPEECPYTIEQILDDGFWPE